MATAALPDAQQGMFIHRTAAAVYSSSFAMAAVRDALEQESRSATTTSTAESTAQNSPAGPLCPGPAVSAHVTGAATAPIVYGDFLQTLADQIRRYLSAAESSSSPESESEPWRDEKT